jgi:hypothetical protein
VAKYSKGDCRALVESKTLTIGPRRPQFKLGGIGGTLGMTKDDPRYFPGPEPFRRERRAIGAEFRRVYGKAAYEAMREAMRPAGGQALFAAFVIRFEEDRRKFKKIA